MILEDYLNLTSAQFRDKPKFISTLSITAEVQVYIQSLLLEMITKFDLDNAVGDQLDVIGAWVGVSRNISIPISGVYFAWDSADITLGWNFGSWQDPTQPGDITSLPDDAYRTLIRAKIAANRWNGSIEDAYTIWRDIFPTLEILIMDNQDMTYDLGIVGGIVDSLTLALFTGGYIPLKPEGVRINEYFVAVDDNPGFAWDIDTDLLKGWDEGSWLKIITP